MEEFARKIYEDLLDHGIRCWLAPGKFLRRDKKHSVISSAVNLHDKLIVILSGNSINCNWMEAEYNHAVEKEMGSGRTVLVPLTLDDSLEHTEQPWAIKMRRSRCSADFSRWQESEAYKEVFGYLLDELSTDEEFAGFEDEFCMEEYNPVNEFTGVGRDVDPESLMKEFRSERRQYC